MTFDEMNRTFVIAAYTVMWVLVGGYMIRLIMKGARLRGDYESARRANKGDDR